MKKMNKGFKYGMLLTLLASTSLALVNPISTEAASEVSQEVVDVLDNTNVSLTSGVTYVDATGRTVEMPIASTSKIKVDATATRVKITEGKKTYTLTNVKEINFKNVTITNFVDFTCNKLEKLTIDNARFQRGIEVEKMSAVQQIVIKNSYFGANVAGINIHDNKNLTTLIVDNSTLQGDLRIRSNKSLAKATISNSVLKDDAIQEKNKIGYHTDYIGTKIERPTSVRKVTSGGRSSNDIFYINPDENIQIGDTRYDASQQGTVYYTLANGYTDTIEIPVGVSVVEIRDKYDRIDIRLSNGQVFNLGNPRDVYFRNANIQTNEIFLCKKLKLESLKFVNSRTGKILIHGSKTLKTFEMHGTEVVGSTGLVSLYDNKALENFIIQDSQIKGKTGDVTVKHDKTLNKFIMNNVYVLGDLRTQKLGNTVLNISNSQFDDSISSDNAIYGEAERQAVGFVPTLEVSDFNHDKLSDLTDDIIRENVIAEDIEDGDITDNVEVVSNDFTVPNQGTYKIVVAITDSDGNRVEKELYVTAN